MEGARNAFINIQSKPDPHLDKLQNVTKDIESVGFESTGTEYVDIECELPNEAIGEILTSDYTAKKV